MKRSPGLTIFVSIICAVVIAVIGFGLYFSGSPMQERLRRFDGQRTQRLDQLSYTIDQYYSQEKQLPSKLADLMDSRVYHDQVNTVDPETNLAFSYRTLTNTSYELCAVFATDSTETDGKTRAYIYGPNPEFWRHSVGQQCFSVNVRGLDVKP